MTIPKDDIWKVVNELGRKNFAHYVDLNKSEQLFNLPYAFQIKACDETERRIQYLINKSKEMKVKVTRPKTVEIFDEAINKLTEERHRAMDLLFQNIEQDVNEKEKFV